MHSGGLKSKAPHNAEVVSQNRHHKPREAEASRKSREELEQGRDDFEKADVHTIVIISGCHEPYRVGYKIYMVMDATGEPLPPHTKFREQ